MTLVEFQYQPVSLDVSEVPNIQISLILVKNKESQRVTE